MGVQEQLTDGDSPVRRYTASVLAAVAAVLVRAALDPVVTGAHALVLPLLAVVFVAWRHGAAPSSSIHTS